MYLPLALYLESIPPCAEQQVLGTRNFPTPLTPELDDNPIASEKGAEIHEPDDYK